MKKVFFDIGTNQLQGYGQLAGILGVDDSWEKVFVEPNPNLLESCRDLVSRIPNSTFIPKALCDDSNAKIVRFHVNRVVGREEMADQGASIYRTNGEYTYDVETVTISDLVHQYDGYEWYFKFDCEGAEFASLPKLLDMNYPHVKFIACEFHHYGRPDQAELQSVRDSIVSRIQSSGITYKDWY